jgi:hypothetical protein
MRKVHFDFDILFQGDIRGGWCGVVGRSGWFSGGRGVERAAGAGGQGMAATCEAITSTSSYEPAAACSDRVNSTQAT